MKINNETLLTFDDVALEPYYNNVDSRTEPQLDTWLTSNIKIKSPLLASPMSSVISSDLAHVLLERGSIPIFHRFGSRNQTISWIRDFNGKCFISWGVNNLEEFFSIIEEALPSMPLGVCLDVAHAHSLKMKNAIASIRKNFIGLNIIAGNVCTVKAVNDLADWGADAIRVGLGDGSFCSTRLVTGFGTPQFSAIMNCAEAGRQRKIPIIADGGIRNSGDIVKSLAAGACTVMLGKMFAATRESGATKRAGNAFYKGQASKEFQREGLKPEGAEGWIPVSGGAKDMIDDLHAGIRSGLTYGGARTIRELQEHAIFVKVTPSCLQESGLRLK